VFSPPKYLALDVLPEVVPPPHPPLPQRHGTNAVYDQQVAIWQQWIVSNAARLTALPPGGDVSTTRSKPARTVAFDGAERRIHGSGLMMAAHESEQAIVLRMVR
jgi:hypothetical protein